MKNCTVIINPNSGHGINKRMVKKISECLKKHDYKSTILFTKSMGHAERIVQKIKDTDLVISMGGDGTFHEVMNGNFKREKKLILSHIPIGTTNDIGHMYGLDRNIINNLKTTLNGEIKEVDIATINNNSFIYVASFGKFMEIPYETPHKLKKRLGHMAYIVSGAKEIFHRFTKYDVTYEIDGVKYNGKYTFIIISNANRIAGINHFYNEMKLDDGKFEVMFCSISKLRDVAKAFYTLKTSDITHVSGVEIYKTDNLKLTFNDMFKPWCLDGEKFESNDKTYNICNNLKVKMLIPKKNIKKLFLK